MKPLLKTKLFLTRSGRATLLALLATAGLGALVLTFGLLPAPAIVFDRPPASGVDSNFVYQIVIANQSSPTGGLTAAQYTQGIQSFTNKFAGTILDLTNSAASAGFNLIGGAHTSDGNPLVLTAVRNGSADLANLQLDNVILNACSANSLLYLNGTKASSGVAFAFGVAMYNGAALVFSNAPPMNGANITNVANGNLMAAGSNVSVTAATNATTGQITFTAALADPINLNQANIGTGWVTNVVTPTNAFGGTVVDFNKGESTTNLAGDLTFTDVSHVTAGGHNSAIVHLLAGASNRTVDTANASLHKCTNWISTLPAGWAMDVLATVQPNFRTNFAQIIYP